MTKNMLLTLLVLFGGNFVAYAQEKMATNPDLDFFFDEIKKEISSNAVVCMAYPVDEKKIAIKCEVAIKLLDVLKSTCKGIAKTKSPNNNANSMPLSALPIPDATVDFMKDGVHRCQLLLFINVHTHTYFITVNLIGHQQMSCENPEELLPAVLSIVTDVGKKYPWLSNIKQRAVSNH